MDPVGQRYWALRAEIARLAQQAGRRPDEISLIAIAKGHPWSQVQPLYAAGCRDMGENRLPEAFEKMASSPPDIQWHFVGALQSSKVRKAIGRFALIHSVDSPELAERISRISQESSVTTTVLLQVNCSGESSKQGLSPEEWDKAMAATLALPHLCVEGLMTMAPLTRDEPLIHRCFATLRQWRDHWGLRHLSMGMSSDYRIAIAEGATLLRIGSALF